MIAVDIIGLTGFLAYCALMQTYWSAFYFTMLLALINNTWISKEKGVGFYGINQKKVSHDIGCILR